MSSLTNQEQYMKNASVSNKLAKRAEVVQKAQEAKSPSYSRMYVPKKIP